APELVELTVIAIGKCHWAIEMACGIVGVAHDAARRPAGQRGAMFLQAAAVVEAAANLLIFTSERARIAPTEAGVQFRAAAAQVAELLMAATVAIAAGVAATGIATAGAVA